MRRLAILILVLAITPLSAKAWLHAADQRIARKSAAMAPPDLRLVLGLYIREYEGGLREAEAGEGTESHYFLVRSLRGKLRQRIEAQTAATIAGLRHGEPLSRIAERLGELAHLLADANNPFHIANDDPRLALSQSDFERYFENRMSVFPTVFYGLDPNFQLLPYLDRTFARTSRFYPLMSEEYFRYGERRTSADFDDRSTAFGVASVCYSHAVTDLVNIYYYIWKEAGGDVRSASTMRRSTLILHAN
ncbi:MAG TPA: hypothetical protein VEZ11_06360 [Thermoanaerobaculia bacterium]|nr:hypothetical protein [Thermoanaerobaculia bacterium]